MTTDGVFIDELYSIIESRKNSDPSVSYTAAKLSKGTDHIAKKIGEEATEVAIAAARRNEEEIKQESADLLFHLLVLWKAAGLRPEEIMAELSRRESISGLTEKNNRN